MVVAAATTNGLPFTATAVKSEPGHSPGLVISCHLLGPALSEFVANADGHYVLVEVGIDAAKVLAAIVVVAIFDPPEDIVGEGIVETGSNGPAGERRIIIANRGAYVAPGAGPAGSAIKQRVIESVTDAGANGACRVELVFIAADRSSSQL